MSWSVRKWVGLGGLLLLLGAIQIAAGVRRGDWSELLVISNWSWSLLPAAFMGVWGWGALLAAKMTKSGLAKHLLTGLAVAYFGYCAFISYDIVAYGNSTSGIAFLFFPIWAAFVMLPLIGLIAWAGEKWDGEAID